MHVYLFDILLPTHHCTPGLGHGSVSTLTLPDHCTYLLLVDSHSKWPEIWEVSSTSTSTSTSATIDVLQHIFSVFSLPKQLVSDNGLQFTSHDFKIFLRHNGIKHFKSDQTFQMSSLSPFNQWCKQ